MKKNVLAVLAVFACASTVTFAGLTTIGGGAAVRKAPAVAQASAQVTGDYVEARTASVFCGACHYNGEAVTVGKEALMGWSIDGGSYNGVDLKGVKAMAALASTENLKDPGVRQTEMTFDNHVSDKQIAAFTALLKEKMGDQLGTIVAVK